MDLENCYWNLQIASFSEALISIYVAHYNKSPNHTGQYMWSNCWKCLRENIVLYNRSKIKRRDPKG